jgi:peptidoglycan/xylan/chitin deacetylase (PgdA/CDA1 family)
MMLVAIMAAACLLYGPDMARAEAPQDASTAVVLVYQRIGEDSVPEGNLSLDRFREHISELQSGGYHVLPLPEVVDALKAGRALPEKSVAITFEGAYLPTINTAGALLREANFPFAVFFSSDQADAASPNHMNFDQLKSLKKDKLVTLGILPSAYAHMTANGPDENAALINKAVSRYRDVFGEDPAFFAWPYGEYSVALKKGLADYHFAAAFGQQSGAAFAGSDMLALPRFTMTDDFGDLDHFRLTAGALPLPVSDVVPEDPGAATQNPPVIGFTVAPEIKDISRLSCFVSDIGKAAVARPGGNRVEIRLSAPLQDRRTRVNCTLPANDTRWRWFGMMLVRPGVQDDDGARTDAPDDPE